MGAKCGGRRAGLRYRSHIAAACRVHNVKPENGPVSWRPGSNLTVGELAGPPSHTYHPPHPHHPPTLHPDHTPKPSLTPSPPPSLPVQCRTSM